MPERITERQNAIYRMLFGEDMPGYFPKTAEERIRRGMGSRADSIERKLIPAPKAPSEKAQALKKRFERGEITEAQMYERLTGEEPMTVRDSLGERVAGLKLRAAEGKAEPIKTLRMMGEIPALKEEPSPYTKPPWWMSPEQLKTPEGKAYADKQLKGMSFEKQIEHWQKVLVGTFNVLGEARTDPKSKWLNKLASEELEALRKQRTPTKKKPQKRWYEQAAEFEALRKRRIVEEPSKKLPILEF